MCIESGSNDFRKTALFQDKDEYVYATNRTTQQIQIARGADLIWIGHTEVTADQSFIVISKFFREGGPI